jgi:alanine racemase
LRSWAEIHLGALQANAAALRAHVPGAEVMAVVKANAYGHGMTEVVRALADRVAMFGVANLSEARAVAQAAPGAAVLILGAALPAERAAIVREKFLPMVSSAAEAAAFAAFGPVRLHLTVDTGMGRMGVEETRAVDAARQIAALPGVDFAGFCSHLPSADEDDAYTIDQLGRFHALVAQVQAHGLRFPWIHVVNSAGALAHPKQAAGLVRAGLALYGVAPQAKFQSPLQPALVWKTRVLLVRDFVAGQTVSYGRTHTITRPTRVATLAVGYADGYPRHVSGRGAQVLIGGIRCPVLGRVTMDQIMVELPDELAAEPGDEAVLLGTQGEGEIPVSELAGWAGTIPWDIFTGLSPRVARLYFHQPGGPKFPESSAFQSPKPA